MVMVKYIKWCSERHADESPGRNVGSGRWRPVRGLCSVLWSASMRADGDREP